MILPGTFPLPQNPVHAGSYQSRPAVVAWRALLPGSAWHSMPFLDREEAGQAYQRLVRERPVEAVWGDPSGQLLGWSPSLTETEAVHGLLAALQPAPEAAEYAAALRRNPFDACLSRETAALRAIECAGGLEKVFCCNTVGSTPHDPPPWVRIPPLGKRFQETAAIALPAADGADHVVLSFHVPLGHDGVVTSLVHLFTGMGFLEGSGDFHWRLWMNSWQPRDYGDLTTSLGSLQSPFSIWGGGIRLNSNHRVQYTVQRPVGTGAGLDPNGRIVCSVAGWFYPLPGTRR